MVFNLEVNSWNRIQREQQMNNSWNECTMRTSSVNNRLAVSKGESFLHVDSYTYNITIFTKFKKN